MLRGNYRKFSCTLSEYKLLMIVQGRRGPRGLPFPAHPQAQERPELGTKLTWPQWSCQRYLKRFGPRRDLRDQTYQTFHHLLHHDLNSVQRCSFLLQIFGLPCTLYVVLSLASSNICLHYTYEIGPLPFGSHWRLNITMSTPHLYLPPIDQNEA